MQVQLSIVPRGLYPPCDPTHRLIAEVGRLQGLNEEGGLHSEFCKAIQQET